MRRLVHIVGMAIVAAAALSGCDEGKQYYVANYGDGTTTPTMRTYDVHTVISDSGYTKYSVVTRVWDMYEDAPKRYWHFPEKLEMEQYDTALNVVATLRCDSAMHFEDDNLWRLDGHVVMVNLDGDSLLTNQLFWDNSQRKIYSDSFIHLVRADRIIEGYGFNSNEALTQYEISRPTGIFPVPKKAEETGGSSPEADAPEPSERRLEAAPPRASDREGYLPPNDEFLRPLPR